MSSTFIDHINTHNLNNSKDVILEDEEKESFSDEFSRKCSIDIHGQPVSSDILVALLDRPGEMKQLAARNAQFYESLEHYITETQGEAAWQKFQDLVYKPREKLPDRAWMNQISQYLVHNPIFLSRFKDTVGYENEDENLFVSAPPPHKLSTSSSTGSNSGRRRSRRLSNMSLGDILDHDEDSVLEEDAPNVPEGMFSNEDQFYQQHGNRRRRSSYHSIQSEPHPTFVESKIDEVDEVEDRQDNYQGGDESDHLGDLLDSDSSDDDDDNRDQNRAKDIGAGYSTPHHVTHTYADKDLIKLREHPDFQANLPYSHPAFFRKAKQLLSLGETAHHFSATIRRNSILEDAMPPSPVTELEEPRYQTCYSEEQDDADCKLTRLICCTRRKQPDDVAWMNGVMEALEGWPELIDRLHDIINESLAD
ncbi:uncharacterized protein EV154DRAFT_497342 [Mucor mucedo]|uniref:uncharacterized protein n=1 Tax=Mucor mucedo TaxID=29922 RepID=UPI002220E505|nr:uncharacterized protein EV154DRAFT_497342 [Mucor mucedo]KAI7894900.1 hypothetical protein EV154DRAFT_497342 [Mucor mucedo]